MPRPKTGYACTKCKVAHVGERPGYCDACAKCHTASCVNRQRPKCRYCSDCRPEVEQPVKRCRLCESAIPRTTRAYRYCDSCRPFAKLALRAKRYGITLEELHRMHEEQGNRCAICRGAPVRFDVLCIDHDHATNRVRALVCWRCNLVIGNAGDDVALLRAAADYLEAFQDA